MSTKYFIACEEISKLKLIMENMNNIKNSVHGAFQILDLILDNIFPYQLSQMTYHSLRKLILHVIY